MGMAHYLDGDVSFVVGTHTHVPTADAQIFPNGTAYQTDAGMCGDYNSIIGMQKDGPLHKFVTGMKGARMKPAEGEGTVCGTVVDICDETGLATKIEMLRLGGNQLSETHTF